MGALPRLGQKWLEAEIALWPGNRSPLLDHEVIEFCAPLPMQYKVKDQVGKDLMKKLAERYPPAYFVRRRKWGFTRPVGGRVTCAVAQGVTCYAVRSWMRNSWNRSLLNSSSGRCEN